MRIVPIAFAVGLGLQCANAATANAAAAIAATATAVEAADACRAAVPYRGQPLRAAPALPDVRGAIDGTFDAAIAERLQQAAAKGQEASGAASMTVAVAVPGSGLWTSETGGRGQTGQRGQHEPRGQDTAAPPLHYWASAGKTLVAVVVLQLVEEGKLALGDPVSRWIKNVPNGDAITIEQLLAHTSGLFSANEDKRVHEDHRYLTPEENLAVARKHGPLFCPGENWRYSNTGYDLLGMIVERVDGRPFQAAIAARIIAPLGLTRMRVLTPRDAAPDVAPPDVAPLTSTKERPINPAWPGAAGSIVASADDMIRFWHALLGSRLLKAETVRRMFDRLYPMFTPVEFYGLGVMVYDLPEADGSKTMWLGHSGGTPGASALVAYSPADRAFVAVALTGDGSAPAVANLLLRALRVPSVPAPAP
jgi:D-alanyl-D-alanine carboxypeptidase